MVAVVSGSGLGLFNSSASSLGGAGSNGNAVVGRGRDRVYVNSSTGNLIVQSVDETLAALGLDFAGVRTYNSQGLFDEDNNDQWRLGVHQRIYKLTGTVNTAGSTVTKIFGDGAEVLYSWNTTRSRYESGDGDGANDFMTWSGTAWTWTDGSSRSTEEYALVAAEHRIRFARDADGNTVTYNYANATHAKLLSSIAMAGATAQTVHFDYNGATTNLGSIRVVSNGVTQTLTSYTYDTANRLETVRVDHTPGDSSVADLDSYTTTYAYETGSNRISSITQKDGSSVGFEYQLINNKYRLWRVTDAEGRITTFTYTNPTTTGGSTVPANANTNNLFNTEPSPPYNRDSTALTTPPGGGWGPATTLDSQNVSAYTSRVAYTNSGDGMAVWRQGVNVHVRRYSAASGTWGPETLFSYDNVSSVSTVQLALDAVTGSAAIAWTQSVAGTETLLGAFMGANGVWTDDITLDSAAGTAMWADSLSVSVAGSHAAVAYAFNGAAGEQDAKLVRFSNNTAYGPAVIDNAVYNSRFTSVAVDANGNVVVGWQQMTASGGERTYTNRWVQATQSFSGPQILDNHPDGSRYANVAMDAQGNAFAVWRQSGGVHARRMNASTGLWDTPFQVQTNTAANPVGLRLDVDSAGNAIVGWTQFDGASTSPFARVFSAASGTWGAAVALESDSAPATGDDYLTVSINGTRAVAAWMQSNGVRYDVYSATYNNGTWSARELMETRDEATSELSSGMDGAGNASITWIQADGWARSPYHRRLAAGGGPPYYPIPATGTTTWRMVANAVYHIDSDAAGAALQAAMSPQTIVNGGQLTGFPPTLTVTSTVPWYVIVNTTDWAQLTQTVYGVQDVGLTEALQTATGLTTLTLGVHLPVPLELPYVVGGGSGGTTTYQSTSVLNSLGVPTSYEQDTQGRVTRMLVAGIDTRFGYDPATGNVATITQDPTGLNRITTFTYDSVTGVLLWTRDSLGNSTQRTYNTNNQLLSEIAYTVPDPDAINTGASPSGAMTTRYAYDPDHHLRFEISADGRVTEHQYNAAGQRVLTFNHLAVAYGSALPFTETDLQVWVAGAGAGVRERIDYRYDWRGNIDRITRWETTLANGDGTGVSSLTQFVYDQRGQLLQKIDPRGSGTAPAINAPNENQAFATTYLYDGLGRIERAVEWLDGPQIAASRALRTRIHTTSYDDLNRSTTVELVGGLSVLSVHNSAGELLRTESGGVTTTRFAYDAGGRLRIATDSTGVRQFSFYDAANRLAGTVDGDGTVTELIYDNVSQLIKTVRHSTLLSGTTLSTLVSGENPTAVTFDSLLVQVGTSDITDRVTRRVYDNAGRLVYSIDEIGAVTRFTYDGANRLVEELRYRNTVSIARATNQVLPAEITVAAHADDRRTRHFYDNTGNLVATLDGEGYLTESTYDNAGHLITRFERANPVVAGLRVSGTLDQLKSSAGTDTETVADPEVDITAQYYYDMQGRLVGELDGETYFTRTNYDVAGNVSSTIRYRNKTDLTGRPALSAIHTAVSAMPSHTHARQYDGAGRLLSEVNFESTRTEYEYDNLDNVLTVRSAADTTDERWSTARYDSFGRVVRELSGEGRVALAALPGGATQTEIDDVWNRYGVLYTYDFAGRRTKATIRPNALQTLVTRYYYDNDDRLRFEVNHLGERKEYRYDAFGQLTDEIKYFNTISTSGLNGGLLNSTLVATLAANADTTRDAKTSHTYTLRGQRDTSRTMELATAAQTFNTFGEAESETIGTGFASNTFTYTRRGQLDETRRGGVLFEKREYDAFGRLARVTDGRAKLSRIEYDRLGRTIATIDALTRRSSIDYDGYSRVTQTDDATPGTNLTIYSYDDAARTTTVDTPAGVRVVTTRNRQDETWTVTVAATSNPTVILDTKTYLYDKNGSLRFTYDDGTTVEERTYDQGGRLETTIDTRGTVTRIEYDAASRVYREIVDPAGLQLTTRHEYDGQGRLTDVTDARGTLTRSSYDRDGRVIEVAIDPNGLNLRTRYAYDTRNNTRLVTEGFGTSLPRRTLYVYDTLGRRSEEIVDPTSEGGTLNLRTQYKYDNNDNMTRSIDSRGFSCWYVYDDKNRLTHKIDALGGVTFMTYDEVDRLTSTRHYVTAINVSGLASVDSPALSNFTMPAIADNDRLERTYYDKDGRERYAIDGRGVVTQLDYDPMGNVTRVRVLAAARLTGNYATTDLVTTELGSAATTLNLADRVTWNSYDTLGRLEWTVDSLDGSVGSVQRFLRDGNGNVIETRKYAASRALGLATDLTTMRTWGSANSEFAVDQFTRFWYDKADRARYTLDSEGYLTETRFNDANRTTTTIAYNALQTGVRNLASGSAASEIDGVLLTDSIRDQVMVSWADAAGRSRLTLDAEGYLSQTRYNDSTGATSTTRYAEKPSTTPTAATALDTAAGYAVTTSARDRTTMSWVDAAGRDRFMVDGESYAVETRYDDVTGAKRVIQYAQQYTAGALTIASELETARLTLTGLSDGEEQRTRTDYDDVGRVKSVVQAETSTDQITEYYGYDAAGNKTKFTNARGTALGDLTYTWDYTYDAAGNLVTETTPNADVHTVSTNATEITVSNAVSQRIVTRFEYDFLGNVIHKHEADGHAQQRTTSYQYDAMGRQVRTFFPVVPVYNPVAGDTDYGVGGVISPNEATPVTIYTETWYDALGNAFRSRDVSGNYSYKTYDRMGRVQYDISARVQGVSAAWNQNYVSYHQYDAFGNQTGFTRYANPLGSQPSTTATSLRTSEISITSSTSDRTIVTTYDRRNLATQFTQASLAYNFWRAAGVGSGSAFTDAATTITTFNAFGEAVRSSRKVSASTNEDTYSYYDRRGHKTAEIDPLKFLTKYKLDAFGNLKEQVDFARAVTGAYDIRTYTDAPLTPHTLGIGAAGTELGFDRTTINTYNRLNRLTLSSQLNVEHAGYNGQLLETRFENVSTSYGYDALGNQIRVTDALNNATYTYYDVLGRTIAVVEPGRVVETGSSVRPATRFFRDAHGNVVKQVEYKSDVTGMLVNNVLPTFNDDATNDRVTEMQYDKQGRVIRTEDANGVDRFSSFYADGSLAKEWQVVHNLLDPGTATDDRHETLVTIYKYDALGQQIETKAPVSLDGGETIRNTKAVYNAFGEIVTKGTVDTLNPAGNQEFFDYDTSGRIWRTNSGDGVTRIMLYDLAGRATLEFRSQGENLRIPNNVAEFMASYALNPDRYMRTETVYDAHDKVLERYTPSYRINNYGVPPVAPDIFVGLVSGSPIAGHVYLHWVGTEQATADQYFYYRVPGGQWLSAPVVTVAGGYRGVDVHALRNQDFEYHIVYRRAFQNTNIAETSGTFRVNISQTIGISSITQGTLSDADAIGNLSIVSTAPSALTAVPQSAEWTSPAQGANYQWVGPNVLHAGFSSVGLSSVRLVVQYYKRTQGYPTWGQGSSLLTFDDVVSTSVNGTEIHQPLGNDASFAVEGGIHSLYRVQVFTADGATLLRDSHPHLAPVGLVWTAPTDQTVTAVFRFKPTANSTFSPHFTVFRLGTQFALNVFPLLTQNTTYDYEVEYRRAGVAIAKRAGQMTSNGEVINHNYAGTVSSTATDGFNQAVGTPTISALTMSWPPPSDNLDPTFEASHGIVSSFDWGTSTAYGNSLNINRPGSGNWSVNLAEIPTPPVNTTYYYRTRYTIGGRVVAEQTGNFVISAPTTSTNIPVHNNGPQPEVAPAVAAVSGSNGILTASWSFNPNSGSQTYQTSPVPGGGSIGNWIGANTVGIGWADTGTTQTVRVRIDYVIRNHLLQPSGPATKWSGDVAGGPTGLVQQPVMWQDGNGTSHQVTPYAGIDSVTRVRVYSVVNGVLGPLLRDSQATGGTAGPPRLTWNAPAASLNLTARITVNGVTTNLTPSGGVYTHSLGSLNGAFGYLIEYFRAGQTPAIVTQSGTVTTDTVSCSVSNVSATNRNPQWITVSHSGPSLSWSQTPVAAGDVSFRYRVVGSGTWLNDLSPPASSGPGFTITFPNAAAGTTQYEYEVRYIRPGESLPYVYSTGTASVERTNNSSTATFGGKADSVARMQQVAVDATLTGNLFRWNYLLAEGSSVTFRYSINGGTEIPVTFNNSGVSQFEVALAGLPEPSSTVTWRIEYKYPNQAPYAAASGSVAAIHGTSTTPANSISIVSQQNQYPTPIQIAQAMDLGNGYLGWTTTVLSNTTATVRYRIDNGAWQTTSLGFEAYGTGLRRQFTAPGAYEYELEYVQSGQPTPYAKTKGTFGVSATDNAPSLMTRTIDAVKVESLFASGPYVEPTPTPTNPNHRDAIWSLPPNPQATMYIPFVQTWEMAGGYRQTSPKSAANPNGIYTRIDPQYEGAYTVSHHFHFKWLNNANVDTNIVFEYRVLGSGGGYTPVPVYLLNGGEHIGADIHSLAANTYEWRVSYTRTGATVPHATASGRIVKDASGNHSVTVDPLPAIPVQDANPVMRQSIDRWGNVLQVQDAANALTNYRYDQRNQLVSTAAPTMTYLDTRVSVAEAPLPTARPMSYNFYDKLGRVIATRDPNGNEARFVYDAAGQMTTKQSADSGAHVGGAFVYNTYNTFGNLVQVTDELGFRTRTKYDGRDQVKEVWREIVANTMPGWSVLTPEGTMQRHAFTYDEAGRRIVETNGEYETLRYSYDLAGNLSLRLTALGNRTRFSYDVHGKKATEDAILLDGTPSTEVYTRQTWKFDYFGRLQDHLGMRLMNSTDETRWGDDLRADFAYVYNYAGQLTNQTSSNGQNIGYFYDRAGQVTLITDSAANRRTDYTYDGAGRRIRERVTVDNLVHQDTKQSYDSHGRITYLEDPNYRVSYSYDLAGNRTLITADYVNHSVAPVSESLYYRYDQMNRVVISQGLMHPSSRDIGITVFNLVVRQQGYRLDYNARGDRIRMTEGGPKWLQNGSVWSAQYSNGDEVTEHYTYDGLGRLTKAEIDKVGGGRQLRRDYILDREGRAKFELTYSIHLENAQPTGYLEVRKVDTLYDADGRVSQQINRVKRATEVDNQYKIETIVRMGISTYANHYGDSTLEWNAGYDKANNLRGYDVEVYTPGEQTIGNYNYITRSRYTFQMGESFLTKLEDAKSAGATPRPADGLVTRHYNANEELVAAIDGIGGVSNTKSRAYVNNQAGQVLTTFQGVVNAPPNANREAWDGAVGYATRSARYNPVRSQHYFYANDQAVGSVGALQQNLQHPSRGNFDVNYTPVSSEYPGTQPQFVVVLNGDTLRTIATRVYGDGNLWYILADENALSSPDGLLTEGTMLRVPNKFVALENSGNIFKPYDPSKAIGDLTPTQPIPPPPGLTQCQVLGMFVVIIVTAIVAYYVGPWVAEAIPGAFGVVIGGAAGAAAGSVAGQTVGIAIGLQDKFDWKAVAMAAIVGGATAGINGMNGANGDPINGFEGLEGLKNWDAIAEVFGKTLKPVVAAGIKAVAISAVAQGTSIAVHLQDKFNWRQLAGSAAGAMAGNVAQRAATRIADMTTYGGRFTVDAFRGLVSSATNTVVTGGKVKYLELATDAFGNAIGNAILSASTRPPMESKTTNSGDSIRARADMAQQESFAKLDAELRSEIEKNKPQITLEDLNLTSPPNIADDSAPSDKGVSTRESQGTIRSDEPNRGRASSTISAVTDAAGDALTIKDMVEAVNRLQAEPLKTYSDEIKLYDADSLKYVYSSRNKNVSMMPYGPGMSFEAFQKREATRAEIWEADNSTPDTAADLIARFPDSMSKQERLEQTLRITGARFDVDVALNVLEQINSGRSFVDLTEARGQSMAYLEHLRDKSGIVAETWRNQLKHNVHDVTSFQIDNIVASRLASWREDDHLLPPLALKINTRGLVRTWNSAELKAGLGLSVTEVAGAAPLLLLRGGRMVNSAGLRFSQDSVSFFKKRPNLTYTYDDIFESMRVDGWRKELANLDVIRMPDGMLTSIDNTRLLAARKLGIDVRVNVREFRDALPPDMALRFHKPSKGFFPKTWGEVALNRIQSQSARFSRANPYGSFAPPGITGRPK